MYLGKRAPIIVVKSFHVTHLTLINYRSYINRTPDPRDTSSSKGYLRDHVLALTFTASSDKQRQASTPNWQLPSTTRHDAHAGLHFKKKRAKRAGRNAKNLKPHPSKTKKEDAKILFPISTSPTLSLFHVPPRPPVPFLPSRPASSTPTKSGQRGAPSSPLLPDLQLAPRESPEFHRHAARCPWHPERSAPSPSPPQFPRRGRFLPWRSLPPS